MVKLSGRDVEDATRLLSLLTSDDERVTIEPVSRADTPVLSKAALLKKAQEIIRNRRRRYDIFDKVMFGEPAWDMLLLLYAHDEGTRQTLSRLAELSGTTKTTALRWIDYLEKEHLVTRHAHPTDRRAVFVQITTKGRQAIELYLCDTAGSGG